MFLAAAGAGRAKHAGQLAVQRPGCPQTAGLIEEGAHLSGHIAETGRGTKDDGVVLRQLLRRGDGRVLRFPACFGKNFCLHGFRHAFHDHFNAIYLVCPFGDGMRHGLDVSVHRIIKHQNLSHLHHSSVAL